MHGLWPTSQQFLPQGPELLLRKSIAYASMDSQSKGQMVPRTWAIDYEPVGILEGRFISISRHEPERQPVALANDLAAQLGVGQRSATKVHHGRLPSNNLWDPAREGTNDPHGCQAGTDDPDVPAVERHRMIPAR